MSQNSKIYIYLISEDVDVWRPVEAEHLHSNVYRILSQPYDRTIETWQFEPGDEVLCEMIESSDGRILAAIRAGLPSSNDIRQESGESEQHKPDCLCDQCLITRWRSRKISVKQAEREIELDKCTPEFQAEWKTFLSKLRPDCELWYYCSPGREKSMGSEGYAIFDNDRLVADIVTRMN